MEIAAALLAGAATFFAGFCLGAFPPNKPKLCEKGNVLAQKQEKFFENFLSYNGEIQP